MSALFLQCPSFFRHGRCQGSRMAASLWWETVAHVLGWLPSFGIIGKRRGEGGAGLGGGGEGGRYTERGSFQPCEIVVSVVGMIFIAFPPFLNTPSISPCFCLSLSFFLSLSPSLPPFLPPPCSLSLSFHAGDQTTILRWAGGDLMPLEDFDYQPALTVGFSQLV